MRRQYPRVIGLLANATGGPVANPPYTVEDFYADFPQFFTLDEDDNPVLILPLGMLEMYIDLAHSTITKPIYREAWRMCMGLFIAHFATLYLQGKDDPGQAGLVASKSVDGVSVSFDNSAIVSDLQGFGTFKLTSFGEQLATYAKMVGIGGFYVR
jgi:hypothetical protein